MKETYFDGPPDVIVEIVSPESYTRDRQVKYSEYEAAGVGEYRVIDPDRRRAEFFRLAQDGRYHLETPDKQGVFRSSAFPGFWVKTDWLWRDPLPSKVTILREMGVL